MKALWNDDVFPINVAALLWTLLFASCSCTPTPTPDAPATDQTTRTKSCEKACTNLRRLHCEDAAPTEEGATCETWCEAAVEAVGYPATCVATAKTCKGADACQP